MGRRPKNHLGKIYCQQCATLFDSQEKFDRHLPGHHVASCESCPLDVAVSKLVGFLKGRRSVE